MRAPRARKGKRRGVRHYPRRLPRQEEIELALELVAPSGWVYISKRSIPNGESTGNQVGKRNPRAI